MKIFSGRWSDRIGERKPFLFWGYSVSSIVKLFFPFAKGWPILTILTPIERIGKGLRTAPRDALIANSAFPEARGKAFGIHRALDTSGAFIGALGAFILFWFLELEFKTILFIAAVIGFFALVPILYIKEKEIKPQNLHFRMSLKKLPLNFKRYLLAATIFALGNFTYMFFVLKSKSVFAELFSPRLAIAIPIILYVWFNIVYALFSIPAGIISDKIGRKRTIILGYSLYSVTCLGFALANSLGIIIILFASYGVCFGLIEGNQRAFASDFIKNEMRGTTLGTFHTTISLAVLPAGIIAGMLWNLNPALPFIYGAVLGILAVLLLTRIKFEKSPI